jgi:hypothetical protein
MIQIDERTARDDETRSLTSVDANTHSILVFDVFDNGSQIFPSRPKDVTSSSLDSNLDRSSSNKSKETKRTMFSMTGITNSVSLCALFMP